MLQSPLLAKIGAQPQGPDFPARILLRYCFCGWERIVDIEENPKETLVNHIRHNFNVSSVFLSSKPRPFFPHIEQQQKVLHFGGCFR